MLEAELIFNALPVRSFRGRRMFPQTSARQRLAPRVQTVQHDATVVIDAMLPRRHCLEAQKTWSPPLRVATTNGRTLFTQVKPNSVRLIPALYLERENWCLQTNFIQAHAPTYAETRDVQEAFWGQFDAKLALTKSAKLHSG